MIVRESRAKMLAGIAYVNGAWTPRYVVVERKRRSRHGGSPILELPNSRRSLAIGDS
jgi:hypothetical protein